MSGPSYQDVLLEKVWRLRQKLFRCSEDNESYQSEFLTMFLVLKADETRSGSELDAGIKMSVTYHIHTDMEMTLAFIVMLRLP